MLIAVDVGNSSIKIGYFTEAGLIVQRIGTLPLLSSSEYEVLINKFIKEKNIDKIPEGIIISSVVPGHNGAIGGALTKYASAEPMMLTGRTETGLRFKVPDPEKLGPDRIAGAVAAYSIYGLPAAVVDFGTASTVSVVGEGAAYIGGAIMPGIHLMNKALASDAFRLSEVPEKPPEAAMGKDTTECIQSGLFYGTAGAVERLLREMEEETGLDFEVVVTGGYSGMLSKFLKRDHDVRPHLTLEGLKKVYERNKHA